MKIYNAAGRLAGFVRENKPEELVLKGSQLRPVLEAAGYEIKKINFLGEPQGLLRRRDVVGQVEAIIRNDEQYQLDQLKLSIRYGTEFVDEEGNLVFVPYADLSAPTQTGYIKYADTRLAEIAGHSAVRIPLPEKVVEMPVPSWTWASVDDWYSSHDAVGSYMFFVSEAREAARTFVAKLAEAGLL